MYVELLSHTICCVVHDAQPPRSSRHSLLQRQNNRPPEFGFENLLFFSHVFKETVTTSQKKRQKPAKQADELITYVMPEDEILKQVRV